MASRTACCLLASWLLHLLAYREQEESLTNLSPAEQLKQLDVCAVGPLRVTAALLKHGLVKKATGKLVIISSQAGSVEWRRTQNKVRSPKPNPSPSPSPNPNPNPNPSPSPNPNPNN